MKFESFKNQKPDPSNSSIREEMLKLSKEHPNLISGRGDVFVDSNTQEKFSKLENQNSNKTQKFIALLLKGVIDVADVVEYEKGYFSHRQIDSEIKLSSQQISYAEIDADLFILREIFGDWDKRVLEEWEKDKPDYNGWENNQNLMINKKHGLKYYYDFDVNGFDRPEFTFFNKKYEREYKESVEAGFLEFRNVKDFAEIMERKVELLQKRLKDKNFTSAIITRSKTKDMLSPYILESIKKRLKIANDVAKKYIIIYKKTG